MGGLTHEPENHTARIALIAFVVIGVLLGLLYWSGERVSERRAEVALSQEAPRAQPTARHRPTFFMRIVSAIQARRQEALLPESDLKRQSRLITLGVLLITASHLWMAASAFGTSTEFGLFVLFTPTIGALAFCFMHWEEARGPATGYALGVAIAFYSAAMV